MGNIEANGYTVAENLEITDWINVGVSKGANFTVQVVYHDEDAAMVSVGTIFDDKIGFVESKQVKNGKTKNINGLDIIHKA